MLQKVPPSGQWARSVDMALSGRTATPRNRSVVASDRMNRLVGDCIRLFLMIVMHTSRLPRIVVMMMTPSTIATATIWPVERPPSPPPALPFCAGDDAFVTAPRASTANDSNVVALSYERRSTYDVIVTYDSAEHRPGWRQARAGSADCEPGERSLRGVPRLSHRVLCKTPIIAQYQCQRRRMCGTMTSMTTFYNVQVSSSCPLIYLDSPFIITAAFKWTEYLIHQFVMSAMNHGRRRSDNYIAPLL